MRPIVLAHGIAPFDEVIARFGANAYFKFIPEHLRPRFEVHEPRVDFAGSVVDRSRELKQEIERNALAGGADKVHIIAHSMGGLDARHMIVDEGMADRVASLTTIGTPHSGTPFADLGLARANAAADAVLPSASGDPALELISFLGLDVAGVADLTTTECAAFNQRAASGEAANPVRYRAVASHQDRRRVFTPLKLSWDVIADRVGDNDGLVPVSSQLWVDVLKGDGMIEKRVEQQRFPFQADHLNQIGWWDLSELRGASALEIWNGRLRFERRVRDLYLAIAEEVTASDP